jgi:cholesterol transport system auxiliary component
MAYTQKPHQIAYFARHEWGETPSQMLMPLLVRSLEATGAFSAVVEPPYSGPSAFALRTEVVELVQDFGQDPPRVRLALRMRLIEQNPNRIVAMREIAQMETMQQKTPEAGVVAANEATARALQEIAATVVDAVQAR